MSDLDSFAFEPGQQVECKTRYDDLFRGEVVAFDLSSKILIIKSPTSESAVAAAAAASSSSSSISSSKISATTTAPVSTKAAVSASSNSGNHDLHCLVLDSVSEVEILEEPQPGKCTNDLPTIGMKSVSAKCVAAYNERFHIIDAVSNGVSQDGISLYKSLSKTYSEINWKDKTKIEVMSSVVISAPYQESDCKALSSSKQDEKAVTYVKSLVAKFWDDNSKQKSLNAQQQETEPSTTTAAISSTTTTTTTSTSTATTTTTTANNQAASKTPAGPASAQATNKLPATAAAAAASS